MPKYLIIIASLLLVGCTSLITRDYGDGGRIEDIYSARNYSHVAETAYGYCQNHGFNNANIDQVSAGCLTCSSRYDIYEFKCSNTLTAEAVKQQQDQAFSEECVAEGFVADSKTHARCVMKRQGEQLKKEKVERERLEKERKLAEARAEKEAREQIKREQAYVAKLKKEKLDIDKAKCDDYGLKRGTSAFSTCLMQIDQAKQQQEQQQELRQQTLQDRKEQAELQQQEIQRKKEAAYSACLGNSGGVRSNFGQDMARASFCAENYDHPEIWPMNRQPIIVAPMGGPPAIPLPRQTRCVPGPDGIMNCQTY